MVIACFGFPPATGLPVSQRPEGRTTESSQFIPTDGRCPGTLYFGSTLNSDLPVPLGWLVCLDRSSLKGTIYVPSSMVRLKILRWDEDGKIEFWTVDSQFDFKGQISGNEIQGEINELDQWGVPRHAFKVRLTAVQFQPAKSEFWGRFYGVQVEGGDVADLAGAELILLPVSNHIEGVVTVYYGQAGMPIFVHDPKAISRNTFRLRAVNSYQPIYSRLTLFSSVAFLDTEGEVEQDGMEKQVDLLPPLAPGK